LAFINFDNTRREKKKKKKKKGEKKKKKKGEKKMRKQHVISKKKKKKKKKKESSEFLMSDLARTCCTGCRGVATAARRKRARERIIFFLSITPATRATAARDLQNQKSEMRNFFPRAEGSGATRATMKKQFLLSPAPSLRPALPLLSAVRPKEKKRSSEFRISAST